MENPESQVVTYVVEVDDDNLLNENVNAEEAELGLLVDSIYTNDGEIDPAVIVGNSQIYTTASTSSAVQDVTGSSEAREATFDFSDRSESPGSEIEKDNDDEVEALRINDLTQRYLTGKLTFSEFVRGTDGDVEEQDASDEDYEPAISKRAKQQKERENKESEAFCKEFDASSRIKFGRKGKKSYGPTGPRVKRILPPVLSNLLGQANLKYAQNEKQIAVQICEEIIRQVPQAPGPYKLLALVQRDKGNVALAHHYSLIAAHLSPQNSDDWIQLAETSLELGERDQALTCLAQAVRTDRHNPDPRLRQIKLLQSMGESKSAQKARENMVETLCSSTKMTQRHGRLILLQAKIAAREFHQENNLVRATRIMECAINACKTSALQDDIHLLVELHCEQNENMKGLHILKRECCVDIKPSDPPFLHCNCPENLAPDLRAKLIVFLVRLDIDAKILSKLLEPFLQGSAEDQGDLFLDIVEALMAKSRYEEAMRLLGPLVESEAFSLAAVWLTHGECLRNLGHTEAAITSYQNVMHLAPQHVQARLTLSSLLCQLNRYDEALSVLHSKEPEPRLLYEEFLLLGQSGNEPEAAVEVALKLVGRYIREDKLKDIYLAHYHRKRAEGFERLIENGPSKEELYEVVTKASDLCVKYKLIQKFKRLAFISLYVKPMAEYRKELEFICLVASVHARDINLSWTLVKEFLYRNKHSPNAWNLYGIAVRHPEDSKHTRFVTRMLSKDPSNWASGISYANNCFIAGAYKDALVEYGSRHKISPSPYTALMLGITWTHIACQKHVTDKQTVVMQSKAFLEEYARMRGGKCQQEIYYNLGRAMHQLSLMELAKEYYKKVLALPSAQDTLQILDLTKEAAFNLSLIYKQSGNPHLARKIINDHIVI